MARPLRLEYAGALYHVTSRGDGREAIFLADGDRRLFLEVLAGVWSRFNWTVHAYCLMTNHYHVLVETPDANLSKGMRQLNGVYTQRFNRTYSRSGHVFQGRYKAILAQKEAYLLELARYVVLNPVRARMVRTTADWPWSSYRDYGDTLLFTLFSYPLRLPSCRGSHESSYPVSLICDATREQVPTHIHGGRRPCALQGLASSGMPIKRRRRLVLLPDAEPCALDPGTLGRERSVPGRRRNASSIQRLHQRTIAGDWPFVSRAVRLRGHG